MMTYRVDVTEQAGAEAEEAYLWILERAPEAAARWWNGLDAPCFAASRHRPGGAPRASSLVARPRGGLRRTAGTAPCPLLFAGRCRPSFVLSAGTARNPSRRRIPR